MILPYVVKYCNYMKSSCGFLVVVVTGINISTVTLFYHLVWVSVCCCDFSTGQGYIFILRFLKCLAKCFLNLNVFSMCVCVYIYVTQNYVMLRIGYH